MAKRKGPTPRRNPKAEASNALTTLFLAYVRPRSPGLVHHDWYESILHLVANTSGRLRTRPVGIATGPLLSRARNELLNMFLQKDDEYLLFTDTDIVFTYRDLYTLLDFMESHPEAGLAGAVYFALGPENERTVVALDELEGSPGVYEDVDIGRLAEELPDGSYDPRPPFPVSGLGLGFTLIRRNVVEDLANVKGGIKRLWPFAEQGEDEGYGEDLTFCLRAAELGYKSYLVPAVKVGHIKEIVL